MQNSDFLSSPALTLRPPRALGPCGSLAACVGAEQGTQPGAVAVDVVQNVLTLRRVP